MKSGCDASVLLIRSSLAEPQSRDAAGDSQLNEVPLSPA